MRLPLRATQSHSKPRQSFRPLVELLEDRNAPDNLLLLAVNDLFNFEEDELFELFAPGVLGNDSDPDNARSRPCLSMGRRSAR